jgi:hypothetical protein
VVLSVHDRPNTRFEHKARHKKGEIVSTHPNKQGPERPNYLALGMSLGMIMGAAIGIALGIATGKMVFLPVFIGAGLPIGMAIGTDLEKRHKENDA